MQLLKKDWINLFHLLKNKRQFLKVIANKVVASEAVMPVNYEVVLVWVKHEIAFIYDIIAFLLPISDNQCHERKRQTYVFVEQNPVMVLLIHPVAFVVVKVILVCVFHFTHVKCLQTNVLICKNQLVSINEHSIARGVIEDYGLLTCVERLHFLILLEIPMNKDLAAWILINDDHDVIWVRSTSDPCHERLLFIRIDH